MSKTFSNWHNQYLFAYIYKVQRWCVNSKLKPIGLGSAASTKASPRAFMLVTLLFLTACSGGSGGGGGSSSVAPATAVSNFNLVNGENQMTVSWNNPKRNDIESINLTWAAYNKDSISNRKTAEDGFLFISNSTQTAAEAYNEYNITVAGQSDLGNVSDGFVIGGLALNVSNAYTFSLQLSFEGTPIPTLQLPGIRAPGVPRSLGNGANEDGFAEDQSYKVDQAVVAGGVLNATLSWRNPQIGAGNIAAVRISYQNNNSDADSRMLNANEYTLNDGTLITYIWEDIDEGIYNFTIEPVLGGVFADADITLAVVASPSEVTVFGLGGQGQQTPSFASGPIFNPRTLPNDFDYDTLDLTISGNVVTNDNDDSFPMVSLISNDVCSVVEASFSNPNDESPYAFMTAITPESTGICEITVTATEDGVSTSKTIRIIFSELFPSFVNSPALNPSTLPGDIDYDTLAITISGSVMTNDNDDVFPVVSLMPNDVCSVAEASFSNPNDESPYAFMTAVTPENTGVCEITVTATEDDLSTPETLSITFPELTPIVAAQLMGSATDLVEDGVAVVAVTATKQDVSRLKDVAFQNEIASSSSPSCIAILDGNGTQQYDGTVVGSTVVANYNVLSGGKMGDCGDFSFTATENGLMGSISLDLAISFVGEDTDNDDVSDAFDLDVDGNGLIEIATADELDMLRNNLTGTGLSGTAGEQGSTLGCPVDEGCNGYELIADIDLVAGGYSNWVAIGNVSSPFTATFDGNDFTLSNLSIRIKHIDNQGLFGVINDAVIRNVNLVGVSVVSINDYNGYPGRGGNNIGGLVGDARGTASMIIDSSASGSAIKGRTSVGGLIGKGEQVQIIRSAATFTEVTGLDGQFVGGLLGNGGASPMGAQISSSSATIGSIVSDNEIGGLLGRANNARVKSSVARVNSIAPTMRTGGKVNMGGLLGNANLAHVSGSMAIVRSIGGGTQVAGGLIGNAHEAIVTSSAAITDSVRTIERISGGLLGTGTSSTVNNSYATARSVLSNIASLQGGLIGLPHTVDSPDTGLATVANSYWDSTRLANADDRLFAENNTGSGSEALNTTNDFTAGGVFAEWGKVYVNRATGDLEIFNIPPDTAPDTSPDTGTHTQTWNLDAFPDQYPLLNLLPISLAEQNAAINRVVMGLDPVSDIDNDGILNELDVDFDGDGLIEIATADELDMTRNNLAGTGFSDTAGEPGENSGCPVDEGCYGYELIANIDLVAGGYSNWVPIGDASSPFTATFDGNDFNLKNLAISTDSGDGLGLFGVINDAVIRNVHLYGVSIAAPSSSSVGSLVGFAQGLLATVKDSSASGSSITGVGGVGGLVGDGRQMQIINSGVTFDSITTTGARVGGLLGYGAETNLLRRIIPNGGARISSSYATIGSISGAWNIGGLVGHADNARIRNSVARIGTMTFTGGDSGGFIGRALYADISGTMAIVQSIIGTRRAGGLIGYGAASRITSSAAIVHSITGSEATAAGLIADSSISLISNSYAVTKSISSTDPSVQGGLVGGTEVGQPATITDSYWDNMLLTTPDTRNENADVIGAGTDVLGTTNDFDAGGIFAEWGKVYVNLATGDLETFNIPLEAVPDASTHTRAWNLDAFPDQYPLFSFLPISLAEQNAAINSVLANESPVSAR